MGKKAPTKENKINTGNAALKKKILEIWCQIK